MTKKSKLTILLATFAAACASAPTPKAVQVPANLKPGDDMVLLAALHAKGVQIYECRPKKDGRGYDWAFVAPQADLFDGRGAKVGKHFAGPRWEANDGSRVLGTAKERADAPVAGAIPWLLLTATSEGSDGIFSKVTAVQRVDTAGGVSPTGGCSQANAGAPALVSYTADYLFFTPK